jgi:SAM-dependent methyltransferase
VTPPDLVLRELARPKHRYHCVYKYVRAYPNLSALELGFGSPEVAAALSGLVRTYHIVDVVDRRGDSDLPGNVPFTQADLNDDFPFSDNEFDCTIAMMVIEHLFDPFHSFYEVARVTRRGGKILINLPNIGSLKCRLQLLRGKIPITSSHDWFEKSEWDGNHLHYFTVSETIRIAGKYGLILDSVHSVGNHLWLKDLRPSLFCHEISFAFSKR